MPFPAIFLWAGAAAAVGVGIKKTIDAQELSEKAENIAKQAQSRYNEAKRKYEENHKNTQQYLEKLCKLKIYVFTHQIKELVSVAQQKNKYTYSYISGYDEKIFVDEIKATAALVTTAIQVGEAGVAGGALFAAGAILPAAGFGPAGGAAMLGALGVPAGGMLGGALLGGMMLGPALAVGGFLMAGKAEQKFSDAYEYAAKVDKAIAEMDNINTAMEAIRTAVVEQIKIITELAKIFDEIKVSSIDNPGFKRMYIIGKSLKDILMIPILKEDGFLNPHIHTESSGYLEIGRRAYRNS